MSLAVVYNSASKEEKDIVKYLLSLGLNLSFQDIFNKTFSTISKLDNFTGYIFLASEENGEQISDLKKFLDYCKNELKRKPAGIISYSTKSIFSNKNIEELTLSFLKLEIFPINNAIRLVKRNNQIGENGDLKDLIKKTLWWAKTLRAERTNEKLSVRIKKNPQDTFALQSNENIETIIDSNYWKN